MHIKIPRFVPPASAILIHLLAKIIIIKLLHMCIIIQLVKIQRRIVRIQPIVQNPLLREQINVLRGVDQIIHELRVRRDKRVAIRVTLLEADEVSEDCLRGLVYCQWWDVKSPIVEFYVQDCAVVSFSTELDSGLVDLGSTAEGFPSGVFLSVFFGSYW